MRERYNWDDFAQGLCERFGEQGRWDVVQEFNRLRQEGTVLEFQAKFEELKFRMINKNPYLNEEYFVSSFIGGLNDELRSAVQVLRPKTVQEAVEGVALQEMTFEALLKK